MKNLSAEEFMELLTSMYACNEAKVWAKDKDLIKVWETCERGDWMLWLLGKMADKSGWLTRKEVVGIACDCAETALKYVKQGETRPAECIAVVRRWITGTATIEEIKTARYAATAAYAAVYAADAAATYVADDAAAYAAAAAAYAADDAVYASDGGVAATAAYAAFYAAAAARTAGDASLKLSADMCRKSFKIEH